MAPKLQQADFYIPQLPADSLRCFLKAAPRLTALDLSTQCPGDVRAMLELAPHLLVGLRVLPTFPLDPIGITASLEPLQWCTKLTNLDLTEIGDELVTDQLWLPHASRLRHMKPTPRHSQELFVRTCTALTTLELFACAPELRMPYLRTLVLDPPVARFVQYLHQIRSTCPSLRTIDLRRPPAVATEDLQLLSEFLKAAEAGGLELFVLSRAPAALRAHLIELNRSFTSLRVLVSVQ